MYIGSAFARGLSLEDAVDLASLPRRRHFVSHPYIERLRRAVVFDHVVVGGLDFDNYRYGSGASIDTDMPPAFMDAYFADGFLTKDPFVMVSQSASGPLTEEDVYKSHGIPERLRYLKDAFGVQNRTFFPLRRGTVLYGGITFSRKAAPFDADEMGFLSAFAQTVYTVVTRPILDKFLAQSLRLSDGEIICLKLASQGCTSEVAAQESGYAVDTVNTYIKSAIKKLGAANRVHGVAEAIRRGLIN